MTFQQAIRSGFEKCVTFSGRASRSEYWYWLLFIVLASLIVSVLGLNPSNPSVLEYLVYGFIVLSHLAIAVRRLHDLDKSGWWYLLSIIPVLGGLFLLAWFTVKGTNGANRFGEDPIADAASV